ncbi:L-lactate dehydrogenase [Patescibacteria group bacterium]|nr:L-lactate dehydrogenase [Patescibacteria group bacterium]
MPKTCKIQSSYQTKFKVSVVGCGNVGSTAAYAMLIDGTPTELVLYNKEREKAEGLLLDFQHSLSFYNYTKLTATDDFKDLKDSNLVVVTVGARQNEGETRLDLANKNKAIFADIIPQIAKAAPDAILLIVSNPVDVLVYEAIRLSGFPENRVFGTGTMLDSARLQFHIGEWLCLSPKSIDAFVLGEHGDSSFPVFSSANVSGKPLMSFDNFDEKVAEKLYQETKNAAYNIIHDLGFTCYAIGAVIKEIMVHIFQHSRIVLPLSVKLNGQYGHSDVALSVPCVLSSDGISEVIEVPLDEKEQEKLKKSVETLKSYLV